MAEAFVPGHITGFFAVHRDEDDPTKSGSQGAGIAIAEGVEVAVTPSEEQGVYLNGEPIEMAAVDRVLRTLDAGAEVRAETDLPLGSGFGVSGAMALGTAMAANRAFDARLSENELITIAHGAEVEAGTGLGDVVAQARGGAPVRLEPGGPLYNKLDGIPASRRIRVEYLTFGELSTEDVIGGDTDHLQGPGEEALSKVVSQPTLAQFMYASRGFAREADLIGPEVQDAIQAVNDADGEAAMAMLGETVFSLGSGLSDAGYDPVTTRIDLPGARLL